MRNEWGTDDESPQEWRLFDHRPDEIEARNMYVHLVTSIKKADPPSGSAF
jgi:hypothetical protein